LSIFNCQLSIIFMSELSPRLEHTILKADTTTSDVKNVCVAAIQYDFAGVCVPPLFARDARRLLGEYSKIKISTVVGFPMGYSSIAAKTEEIKRAIDEGADEIDGVVNIAAVKSGNWNHVEHDIDSLARATQMRGKTLKLILECGFLTQEELSKIIAIAAEQRVKWLQTGTGFHGFPVTPEMVQSLRKATPADIKIKASGGIRTAISARALIEAGADRLGTSSSVQIIQG
jgi:deoxyribose-phosphate aldolase